VRPVFEEVFSEVIQLLADMGLVTLDTYFLDGTKIEANANRFTFVWAKSTRRYKEQLRAMVRAHLAAIDEMDDEEEALAPTTRPRSTPRPSPRPRAGSTSASAARAWASARRTRRAGP
jgi:hypothetical protein